MLEFCDVCGNGFHPDETTFLGVLDGPIECSPFMTLDTLCNPCYEAYRKKHPAHDEEFQLISN